MTDLLKTLVDNLPRYAEEEGHHFSISRAKLVDSLHNIPGIDESTASTTVRLCEGLLDTLAVLDKHALSQGEWCFISFPAQMLATSILVAWSDPESQLFSPQFWNTQGVSSEIKNRQRNCLNTLENARVEHHASRSASPVRYIYVAWAVIKREGKILFYQREDTQKRHDRKAGDYVFPGGRSNHGDIPDVDRRSALQALQAPNSHTIIKALHQTLHRELLEETGLEFERHYEYTHWRTLKPYRQVEGAAPNHALTEYYIDLYHIELNLDGYLWLDQTVKGNERLVWATLDEVIEHRTRDGKTLYIKALHQDFSERNESLTEALTTLPDSFQNRYLFDREKYGITFPVDDKPVVAGVLGKEKPLPIELGTEHKRWLLGLAAHARQFECADKPPEITLHPHGWIEIDAIPLPPALVELVSFAEQLWSFCLSIENHHDRFFRLSIDPACFFFDESLFLFSVAKTDLNSTKNKIPVRICRQPFDTALGMVKSAQETFELTLEHVSKLIEIRTGAFQADNEQAVKVEDAYKKGLHKDLRFTRMGLRNLIRREAGIMRFVLQYEFLGDDLSNEYQGGKR